jgi:hypothetical protein
LRSRIALGNNAATIFAALLVESGLGCVSGRHERWRDLFIKEARADHGLGIRTNGIASGAFFSEPFTVALPPMAFRKSSGAAKAGAAATSAGSRCCRLKS